MVNKEDLDKELEEINKRLHGMQYPIYIFYSKLTCKETGELIPLRFKIIYN